MALFLNTPFASANTTITATSLFLVWVFLLARRRLDYLLILARGWRNSPRQQKTWFSLLILVFHEFIERLPLLRHRAGAVKSKVGPA
jgi:hypothetical protein